MPLQLFESYCPFNTSTEEDTLLISGFASTNLIDREGAKVEPLEFDVLTFMNSPSLYRNHKLIPDGYGQDRVAGVVRQAVPAYLSKDMGEEWEVRSLGSDNEFVAYWPKIKSPKMVLGDRGLFVVAEVTHPSVIDEINRGEMGAFSWRGYSYSIIDPNGVKHLKSVDLVEISVVNTPAQNQSNFIVTSEDDPNINMEVSLKTCDIYQIGFDKNTHTLGAIQEYAKNLNLEDSDILETKDRYFVNVSKKEDVARNQSFAIKVGELDFIAAPLKKDKIERREAQFLGEISSTLVKTEKKMPNDVENINEDVVENVDQAVETVETGDAQEVEAVEKSDTVEIEGEVTETEEVEKSVDAEAIRLFVLDESTLKNLFPGTTTELQKSLEIDGIPSEIYSLEFPIVEEVEIEEVEASEEAEEVEKSETVDEPTEEVPSDLDVLKESVDNLTQLVTSNQEVMNTLTESFKSLKEDVAKQLTEKLQEVKETEKAVNDQKESIAKQLEAFNKQVPEQTPRKEKETQSKSEGQTDIFAAWKTIKTN